MSINCSAPAIFMLNEENEADGIVYYFCDEECQAEFSKGLAEPFKAGYSPDYIETTRCDSCGRELA